MTVNELINDLNEALKLNIVDKYDSVVINEGNKKVDSEFIVETIENKTNVVIIKVEDDGQLLDKNVSKSNELVY